LALIFIISLLLLDLSPRGFSLVHLMQPIYVANRFCRPEHVTYGGGMEFLKLKLCEKLRNVVFCLDSLRSRT
jgi:hypothetical protein